MQSPGAGAADGGQVDPGSGVQASGRPAFANPVRIAVVDSTNRWLRDAALAGAPHGSAVLAAEQLAGRGRRDRAWSAPPGSSVLCSLLFRSGLDGGTVHLAPALVGLAALHAIRAVAGVGAMLKWPNDVIVGDAKVGDAKVGGILSELVGGPEAVVVGIGINVAWPPGWPPPGPLRSLVRSATTLERAAGRPVARHEVENALLAEVARSAGGLETASGREVLAARYRAACSTLGRPVQVQLDGETLTGRAVEIAGDGRLVLELPGGGRRHLDAGDVVHLRRAGAG
ncbi:MAG: biotin--[acetyl-CoA-carboxylase] ligase [Acidimicrobiales bacterium]